MRNKRAYRLDVSGGLGILTITRKDGSSHVVMVDQEDIDLIVPFNWYVTEISGIFYAHAATWKNGVSRPIPMHRIITASPPTMVVDHINHNGLDNRRANLRIVPHAINLRNRRKLSKYVYPHRKAWVIRFCRKGRLIFHKRFNTRDEAIAEAERLRPAYFAGEDMKI